MAEDVFQQTWMRATERIRRYDASRPFGPWLLTVGRNLALDHLRRYRPESLDAEPAAPTEGPGTIEDPFARVSARERRERLEAVLPLVKKYGAAVVAISNDETGISEDPDERFAVAKKIVE